MIEIIPFKNTNWNPKSSFGMSRRSRVGVVKLFNLRSPDSQKKLKYALDNRAELAKRGNSGMWTTWKTSELRDWVEFGVFEM